VTDVAGTSGAPQGSTGPGGSAEPSLSGYPTEVFKAYDIRGIVPAQFHADLARAVGAAVVEVLGVRVCDGGPGAVVVGQDMRPSGDDLVAAFADGVCSRGCDVVRIGLASTDGLYFASGDLGLPGAMFTASHNPAEYNGIKVCRAGAAPVGMESGLREIRDLVRDGMPPPSGTTGMVRRADTMPSYAAFLRGLVDLSAIRPLSVVVDAGNGMAGITVPAVLGTEAGLGPLPLRIDPMYFELDGTFPNHEANPIDPDNLRDLQARVVSRGADVGLAFDGDADRCFVVDERGVAVSPSAITALIARRELQRNPGATIIYNCISSRVVPEVVAQAGGVGERTRVGHSFIKARMAETGAVFGGEHSGHFYFADFWRADSGMLAAMHVLAALGSAPEGTPLSALLEEFDRYAASGEINSVVSDAPAATQRVRQAFSSRPGLTFDDLDGMTVSAAEWWFNLRPSNTEPLLRLNVEAVDGGTMEAVRDEVLAIVRS
jgi:phosphomannomutase